MELHHNVDLFRDAITATAQRMKIPEIYVEKDYWVTLALKTIFESEIGHDAVFKGGTALSKCYKLIDRFSEDIDFVVLRREGESDNQLKTKIRNLTNLVGSVIPEIEVAGVTRKMGMNRKTVHAYSKGKFLGDYGQIREHIVVEATWLGNFEPYTNAEVSSFVAEMMSTLGQQALIDEHSLHSFSVRVLTMERTLCEKIMSLVRFSHSEEPYEDLSKKIRHVYDIHMLLRDQDVASFFNSSEFDKLLNIVGNDDILTYKNNNDWLRIPPQNAIIYANPKMTWSAIRQPYKTTFKDLVTGDLPEEAALLDTLELISARLKSVTWKIKN